MKILTTIRPRRDGTVVVAQPGFGKITFAADEAGDLVADVADETALAFLLARDDFQPADAADYAAGEALLKNWVSVRKSVTGSAVGGTSSTPEDDDGEDDDGDEELTEDQMAGRAPLEAGTAPKTGKVRKARAVA